MARGGFLRRIYTAGLTLALFALTFKALLPPGYMLSPQSGEFAITLCNGGEAFFDARTGDIRHQNDAPASDTSSEYCPFAAAAPSVVEVAAAGPSIPRFAYIEAPAPILAPLGAQEPSGPPLPARGPPHYA